MTVKAILSQPREGDEVRLEGRVQDVSLRLTVEAATDVRADREGRPDRIQVDGTWYEVAGLMDDKHPFVGDLRKKTVLLTRLPGR